MKKLCLVLSIILPNAAFAQAVADPAYVNMQKAISGIIQQTAANRGVSISDPRTYSTLYSIGKTTAAVTATAAAGAVGVATAPGWMTALALAAAAGAISYAVPIGIDALVKWKFGDTPSSPVITSVSQPSDGIYKPSSGQACTVSSVYDWCEPNGGFFQACLGQGYNPTLPCSSSWNSYGFSGAATTRAGAMAIAGYSDVKPVITTSYESIATATKSITETQKTQPVDHSSMALMVNYLWQKAAAETSYNGIPYVQNSPITTAEVKQWAEQNAGAYPSVQGLITPVAAGSTGFAPSITTSAASSVTPATTPTSPYALPTTTTATTADPKTAGAVDLGSDPKIGSPALDAPNWLQPLINMLPGWRSATFTQAGECYKPTIDLRPVINKTIILQSQCDLLEKQRETLSKIMSAVWVMAAAFIILRA